MKTTLNDIKLSVDSVDTKVGYQASRVRQLNGLFRGLQSKVDQYTKET